MARFADFQSATVSAQPVETREGEWAANTGGSTNALSNLGKMLKISAAAPLLIVGTLAVAGVAAPAMLLLAPVLFAAGAMMESQSKNGGMTATVQAAKAGKPALA